MKKQFILLIFKIDKYMQIYASFYITVKLMKKEMLNKY